MPAIFPVTSETFLSIFLFSSTWCHVQVCHQVPRSFSIAQVTFFGILWELSLLLLLWSSQFCMTFRRWSRATHCPHSHGALSCICFLQAWFTAGPPKQQTILKTSMDFCVMGKWAIGETARRLEMLWNVESQGSWPWLGARETTMPEGRLFCCETLLRSSGWSTPLTRAPTQSRLAAG